MRRFILVIFMFVLASCAKEPSAQFVGQYSYKLSGNITLEQLPPATPPEDGKEFAPNIYVYELIPESGQIRVLKSNEDSSKMLVTMNALAGSAVIGNAVIKDDKFDLSFDNKTFLLKEKDGILLKELHCSLKGLGQRLDNTLILKLNASGTITIIKDNYKIIDSKIECVAGLN